MTDVFENSNTTTKPNVFGRKISDFPDLSAAELNLIDCVRGGRRCTLGTVRPSEANEDLSIRAGIIRFLALGGDKACPIHEHGIALDGAHIKGDIDFIGAERIHRLRLEKCHVEGRLLLYGAKSRVISLNGSRVAGIGASRLQLADTLHLEAGFESESPVLLIGAKIGGDLFCSGTFRSALIEGLSLGERRLVGVALVCSRMHVDGSIFMRGGFCAEGEVRLRYAKVGGFVDCSSGRFVNHGQAALSFRGATVEQTLALSNEEGDAYIDGDVDLTNCFANTFRCYKGAWPKKGHLTLDGFEYHRIVLGKIRSAEDFSSWLLKQSPSDLLDDFKPQPFEQLAKALRHSGRAEDARQVGYLKQSRLSKVNIKRAHVLGKPFVFVWRNVLLGFLVGYGYRPHRVLLIAFLIWATCGWIYDRAAEQGAFAPAVPALYISSTKDSSGFTISEVCAKNWTSCSDSRMREFGRFSAHAYAADLILPFVDLGQESRWIPMTTSFSLLGIAMPSWGLRLLTWLEIGYGWLAGLILAGVFSGAVKKD